MHLMVEVYALQCSAYKQVVRHSIGTVQLSTGRQEIEGKRTEQITNDRMTNLVFIFAN